MSGRVNLDPCHWAAQVARIMILTAHAQECSFRITEDAVSTWPYAAWCQLKCLVQNNHAKPQQTRTLTDAKGCAPLLENRLRYQERWKWHYGDESLFYPFLLILRAGKDGRKVHIAMQRPVFPSCCHKCSSTQSCHGTTTPSMKMAAVGVT